jgi:hypothetical protein
MSALRCIGRGEIAYSRHSAEYLAVLTDRPPRQKALLTEFVESDQLTELELPADDRLRISTMSIESTMKDGTRTAVHRACAGFAPSASPRGRLGLRAIRRLLSHSRTDSHLDADRSAQASDVVRDVPEHALSRVLPSSRLSTIWVSSITSYPRVLRAYSYSLPPRARNSD